MKNQMLFIVTLFVVFVSMIYPQEKFRHMIYLCQSIGGHIYNEGVITNVPAEVDSYNVKYGLTGENAVQITKYPDDDYPPGGNQMWNWQKAFYDSAGYSFKEEFLDDTSYSIIMVKFCAASQSAIWFYWYEGPQDTINYPQTQSYYNYQWYIRKIVRKMEEYPNKFFILWNLPSGIETMGNPSEMQMLADFNYWMTDSLANGLDAQIGDFPPNIYVFDYFNLLKSPYSNYMDSIYRDAPDDYHPNAAASEVVAPELVEQTFNAAIVYENLILPVELISFNGKYNDGVVNLEWITATEKNNLGFEVERRNDHSTYEVIGFVNGNGTTTNRVTYNFIDENLTSKRYYYRLKQINTDGTFEYSNEIEIDIDDLSDFQLYQNYPNPFNPGTEISFNLAESGNITLKVYDSLGSTIATLVDGFMNSGKHKVWFNAKDFTTGIYYYRIKADNFTATRKMLLIK